MSETPRFLSLEVVLALHADTIREEGGATGLRDRGLLESALAMPQAQFGGIMLHPDLASMSAAYLFHIASNHAFVDGNKRVAALSALIFLDRNGVPFKRLPEQVELERVTMAVARRDITKEALIEWFRQTLSQSPD
ncbi:MAG: type II toxin-antitoxin system death-on-curing family toxin [Armatimonadetes bacterium]|nr:type II toxin-antitoxin system death-on-curing family toxin [Armatimonadota bacterium]